MDFIYDYDDTIEDSGTLPPVPAPPLNLSSLNTYKEDITKKLSNLNIFQTPAQDVKETTASRSYAEMSLEMLSKEATLEGPIDKADVLESRLNRVLNSAVFDSSMRDSLKFLEEKIPSMDIVMANGMLGSVSRRELRGEFESEFIKGHHQFFKHFSPVVEQINLLGSQIDEITGLYDSIERRLCRRDSNLESKLFSLQQAHNMVSLEKSILVSFKQNYTLSHFEEHTLLSGEVGSEFLVSLRKAQRIYDNCSVILSMDNPRIGIELMGKMNHLIEIAIERLTTFVSKCFTEGTPNEVFTEGMRYLSENPQYLNTEKLVGSRSKMIVHQFKEQMKNDVYRVYDSQRFLGDLLAYLHGVLVNENENLETVFSAQKVKENLMNQLIEPLIEPLEARVSQTIYNESKLQTAQTLLSLLGLYKVIFHKVVSAECIVFHSLERLESVAVRRLFSLIEETRAKSTLVQQDLQVPDWLMHFYNTVLPLFNSEIVLMPQDATHLKKLVVDDVLETVQNAATQNSQSKRDRLIFSINCLDYIQSKILPFSFFSDKSLSDELWSLKQSLTSLQFNSLLFQTNLSDIYNLANMIFRIDDDLFDVCFYQSITENQLFKVEVFQEIDSRLESFIPVAMMELQQELIQVVSPLIVSDIVSQCALMFVQFYCRLKQIVDEYLGQVFRWTDIEVATLLGCDEEYEKVRNYSAE